MRFIYDIVVNYENNFFEFYEWEKEDNIINIKKMPLFLVNNETYKIIKYESVTINSTFVDKIRDKTFAYNKIKIGPSCLITNGMEVIGILCNDKGEVIKDNPMHEDNIFMCEYMTGVKTIAKVAYEAADIDIYDIDIIKRKKINKNNINRREAERREFLINYINSENNNSNLKYLYYDYFEKENEDISLIKKELINEIKHNWNKKLNSFYETAKIINRIKN